MVCVAAACHKGAPPGHVYDLVENYPLAELLTETAGIDFGAPGSQKFTLAGWSHRENAGNISFMWGLGDVSAVRWFVTEPHPLTLRFRVWPVPDRRPSPPQIQWVVNDRRIQSFSLKSAIEDHEVSIPADALVSGWNRFDFQYSYHRRKDGRRDPRPLAVAWDWLRSTSPPPYIPRTATGKDPPSLTLPQAARLDYYLTLGPDTRFVFDDLLETGSGEGTESDPALEVEFQVLGLPATKIVARRGDAGAELDAGLPAEHPRLARVSLRTTSNGGAPRPDRKLTLVRPRLYSASPIGLVLPTRGKSAGTERHVSSPPNVIVYLIDTLRADHLSCYGYAKPTTPHIDAFAKRATRFTHAVAQSSWTRASVASIFTGLRPQAHGVNDRGDALPADALTLAELLHEHGYLTGGLVTNGNVAPSLGFDQGFDSYQLFGGGGAENALPSDQLNQRVSHWLDEHATDQPFFLYVHSIDPHGPYTPPDAYRRSFARGVQDPAIGSLKMLKDIGGFRLTPDERLRKDIISLYDAEIAFNDASFGAFIEELHRRNLYDSALIILVSDHGEEFADHGWWEHGRTLYQEQLHVPLIIKFPGGWEAGRASEAMAQHVDLLPTILAEAGIEIPEGIHGSSLTNRLEEAATDRVDAISYLKLDGNELDSILHEGQKLVRNHEQSYGQPRPSRELYALTEDPAEQRNLVDDSPVLAGYLRTLIVAETSGGPASLPPAKAVLPEDVKEHLRALGYDQ